MQDHTTLQELEEATITYWKEQQIFEKSISQRSVDNVYTFVDGPPFVTGSPHYGSLLPSIAKDVIPRYQTMLGKRVRRVFGWDCHGLPIEEKVSKELKIKSNKDIDERVGIPAYIKACRDYVNSCSNNWRWYIQRIGRWVDMDNAYYTMSPEFMESVLWAFKRIYDQGLIYRGKRVSLYSTDTATPVSQFEVAMDPDNYRGVDDLSVFVKFNLDSDSAAKFLNESAGDYTKVSVVAWTTTPWTIPANFALAVNPDYQYALVAYENELLILAKDRLAYTFKVDPGQIGDTQAHIVRIIREFPGSILEGLQYLPVYDYFVDSKTPNDFQVYLYDGVTIEDGTGVLHVAPAFGEEDFNLGQKYALSQRSDIDEQGLMTVGPWQGTYLRDASPQITEDMQQNGHLLHSEIYRHRLPFYRGANPLIYMAQDAYFINIQKIKARMQELNQEINWIPAHIKEGRFLNTIQTAPDWCISRNRYWATIMPIWKSADGDEIVVGSIAEMAQYTNQLQLKDGKYYYQNQPVDLHRDVCDQIILTKDGKQYHRIPEVLDCWMDSGSAPFAEYHYPFENKEIFEKSQPADFIIEYVGQIRAWFNVLLRLSTMTSNRNAYTNVICTGVLAGTDGRKMSKSFGNYPDPKATIEKYGADALRLYFMSSPVMVGEDMNFSEQDLADQLKSVLNILWNSYKYYQTYQSALSTASSATHLLDNWIKVRLQETILTIASALDQYNIPQATRAIRPFVDDLSTWYIRRSRDRLTSGDASALQTLHDVLETFAKATAPIIPFITENIFRGLNPEKHSVHLEDYPQASPLIESDQKLLTSMRLTRQIASLGQAARLQAGIKIKQPLASLYLKLPEGNQLEPSFLQIIADELNVKAIELRDDFDESHTIHEDRNIQVALNTHITPELEVEGKLREILRALQELRKQHGLKVQDEIDLQWSSSDPLVQQVFQKHLPDLRSTLKVRELVEVDMSENLIPLLQAQLHTAIHKA